MQPEHLTPPWHPTKSKGFIAPECVAETLLFDPEGNSIPGGGPPWADYGIWLWPHTLLLWKPGTEKPTVASGTAIIADRQPALSRAALVWCMSIIDHGKGVMLCGRTKMAIEVGARLVAPMIGGAGNA